MLQIGEARQEFARGLARKLHKVINDYKLRYPWYYVLVVARWEGEFTLTDKIIIMGPAWFDRHKVKPDRDSIVRHFSIYNCMLFYVNNKTGQYSMEHCAPEQYYVPDELLSGQSNPYIGQSAEEIARTIIRN